MHASIGKAGNELLIHCLHAIGPLIAASAYSCYNLFPNSTITDNSTLPSIMANCAANIIATIQQGKMQF